MEMKKKAGKKVGAFGYPTPRWTAKTSCRANSWRCQTSCAAGRASGRATRPRPVEIHPGWPFNIIYPSGTTGTPKGIVHPHAMRWAHTQRSARLGYGPEAVTLLSTPLYSNTTLVSLLPTIALGGTAILMAKFDVRGYLELAQRCRVTHTMLVPVQYQRLMAFADFDRYDLSSFRLKRCTSAPLSAE